MRDQKTSASGEMVGWVARPQPNADAIPKGDTVNGVPAVNYIVKQHRQDPMREWVVQ